MRLQLFATFAVLSSCLAARADSISYTEFDHEYFNQSGSVFNATGAADILYFHAAVGPVSETIDLTNSAGIVTDTIFSPSGMRDPYYPGDAFEFAGVASGNAAIGTLCVASSTVACVVNTGGTIDLTSIVNSQSSNGITYTLESGSLTVEADDSLPGTAPEPSSFLLLGSGLLLGVAGVRRRMASGPDLRRAGAAVRRGGWA